MLQNPLKYCLENILIIAIFLCFFIGDESVANAKTAGICDQAADLAARETGVPLSILKAVTRTETGRTQNGSLEPWPWAVNAEGKGFWFASKTAAVSHAQNRIRNGFTNVDIGCFQLNYRWHGDAFSSSDEMFDPTKNARYAAQFLVRLYDEKGDWISAVGAYHSRTQKHAARYKRKFSEIHQDLNGSRLSATTSTSTLVRQNQFPLLMQSNSRPTLGSLVPLGDATSRGALITQKQEL